MLALSGWYSLKLTMQRYPVQRMLITRSIFGAVAGLAGTAFFLLQAFSSLSGGSRFYTLYFVVNAVFTVLYFTFLLLAFASLPARICRAEKARRGWASGGVAVASGAGLFLLFWIPAAGSFLQVREITLTCSELPAAFDGFRIVQISDTHLGCFHHRRTLVRMAEVSRRFQPDMVAFTGDLVNNFAGEAEGWTDLLGSFTAGTGKYAVRGNHDYGDYSRWRSAEEKQTNREGIRTAYRLSGFRLLSNESVALTRSGDTVYVAGVENRGSAPSADYSDLTAASREIPAGAFAILLTHEPQLWLSGEVSRRFTLSLAGHTHGLQWGPDLAGLTDWLARKAGILRKGLFEQDGSFLYVNAGIGITGLCMRVALPPEITLITLKRS